MADTSHGMTAERLEEIRYAFRHDADTYVKAVETRALRDVLAHIDAQAAEIERLTIYGKNNETLAEEHFKRAEAAEARLAALSAPVGDAEVTRLIEWLSTPLFEGEDAPAEHAEAADLIRRLASSLARVRADASRDTWDTVIRCASNAAALFPKDTDESLHHFGSETVLRALLTVRNQSLATLNQPEKADDPDSR